MPWNFHRFSARGHGQIIDYNNYHPSTKSCTMCRRHSVMNRDYNICRSCYQWTLEGTLIIELQLREAPLERQPREEPWWRVWR